ncbi:phosphotransferase [Alicyclobacillus acidoterrestris]
MTEFINRVPKQLMKLVTGYEVRENSIGHSTCSVFHLRHPSKQGLYLKIQPISNGDLRPEKERLEWLQGKLPVPELLYFDSGDENQYMLASEIQGVPSFDLSFRGDLSNLANQLAMGLRTIHSLDTTCPFSSSLNDKITLVQERISNGSIDVEYLSQHYPNPNLRELFDEMMSLFPDSEDLVVCYGDYSMPNVLLVDGRISGFIDLGQLAVADRYVDIVTVRDTLSYNKLPDECF